MKKGYLLKSMLLLVLVVAAVSCSKEEIMTPEEGIKNAEDVLGVTIDPRQDWKMAEQITGDVTVNLGMSSEYTVAIYDVNPLNNPDASYYVRKTVREGEKSTFEFSLPTTVKMVYAVAFDSYHRSLVKQVPLTGSSISINFGGNEPTRSSFVSKTRAIEPTHDFASDIPAKPTSNEMTNADNFKTGVNGIKAYNDINYGNGFASDNSACYIDESVNNVNIWQGGYNDPDNNWAWVSAGGYLYVKGNCNFTGKTFSLPSGYVIYIVKNASLTIDNGFQGGCKVYLSEGARLTVNNNISTGNVSYYSKGGSIRARGDMVVNGITFANGFATHANSETTLGIQGKYRAFRTSFGLDDESLCSEGVSVEIIGDGKVLAASPVFQNGVVHTLSANTEGVQNVVLKTTAKGSIDCSHVDFVNTVLIP